MNRKVSAFCAGSVLALCLFGTATAGTFEDAQIAYDHGDYATALQILRPLAEHGDAHAQFLLGLSYEVGQGVPKDPALAASWYKKAAGQGLASAETNLGTLYADGRGVPQDYSKAISLWRAAAAG